MKIFLRVIQSERMRKLSRTTTAGRRWRSAATTCEVVCCRSHNTTITQRPRTTTANPDEGHGFSRAAQPATFEGFSPW